MDAFGDHLVSCKKNKLTQRHHAVRDALASSLKGHGIGCRVEVAIAGRQRPADLALDHFDPKGPLAVDIHVNHPLAPGLPRALDSTAGTLSQKDADKVTKYGSMCESAGWLFTPLGFHPWGGLAPLGCALLNRLLKQVVGDCQGWLRQHKIQSFRHDVSFSLMKFVAQQLLPIVAVVPEHALPLVPMACAPRPEPMAVDHPREPPAPPPMCLPPDLTVMPVSPMDMDDWHCEKPRADECSEFRVGPLRVRCRLNDTGTLVAY